MANHYSALKRARQTETKTTQNRANKSRLRSALRSLREAIAKGDKEEAQKAYSATVSVVDKGVQKGTLHKNTASRYKARLNKRVKAVAQPSSSIQPTSSKADPIGSAFLHCRYKGVRRPTNQSQEVRKSRRTRNASRK